MSILSILLKLARQVVESVMGQLMQQFNVVQEQAMSPMKAMVDQVVGGVWVGDGADAFVEEVSPSSPSSIPFDCSRHWRNRDSAWSISPLSQ